jgi:hypothetical protein
MEQDKVNKVSDVGKNVWDEDSVGRNNMEQKQKKVSFRERWNEARPTKTIVFWSWVGSIVLTMIIGFVWGGWVTGGTAQKMAEVMAADAVSQRLVPICVDQFNQDPVKEEKLIELQAIRSYDRDDYVKTQGWATIPGEDEPDGKVAVECARLLVLINE